MKILITLALVALATTGNCFPGQNRRSANQDEVEILPFAKRNNPFGVIDVDAGSESSEDDFPFMGHGWSDSFSSFMRRITDLVKNVRTEVAKDFEDKLKNGNTTSTVEIIDGHKVIKNQTIYEDPHTYVKSVVYQVIPNDDETTSQSSNGQPELDTESTIKTRDREPLEDSVENEVSALNEDANINIETLDDNTKPQQHFAYNVDDKENDIESFEIIEPESVKFTKPKNPSGKIPEKIESLDESNEIPTVPEGSKYNVDSDASNTIETFEPFKPYDLSQDTRVNDILRDQGYTVDPDVEIFNVEAPKLVVT